MLSGCIQPSAISFFFFVTPHLVPDHTLNPRPHYKSYGFTKILQKGIKAIDSEYGFLGGLTEVSDEAMYLRPSHPDWPQNKTSGSLVNDIPRVSASVSILVHRSFYNSWLKCPRTRSKKKEKKKKKKNQKEQHGDTPKEEIRNRRECAPFVGLGSRHGGLCQRGLWSPAPSSTQTKDKPHLVCPC